VRADAAPTPRKPWTVRTPARAADALRPVRHKLLVILEAECRNRPYCLADNKHLARRYGCCERRMQVLLREAEADQDLVRVRSESRKDVRLGIVLRRRIDPERPVADTPSLLRLAIARVQEERRGDVAGADPGRWKQRPGADPGRWKQRPGRALFPAPPLLKTEGEKESSSSDPPDAGAGPGDRGRDDDDGSSSAGTETGTIPKPVAGVAGPGAIPGPPPGGPLDPARMFQAGRVLEAYKRSGFGLVRGPDGTPVPRLLPGWGDDASVPDPWPRGLALYAVEVAWLIDPENRSRTGGAGLPAAREGGEPAAAAARARGWLDRPRAIDPEGFAADVRAAFAPDPRETPGHYASLAADVRRGVLAAGVVRRALDLAMGAGIVNRAAKFNAEVKAEITRARAAPS